MPDRRRNSRISHREIASPYHRERPGLGLGIASGITGRARTSVSSQQTRQQPNLDYLDYFDFQNPPGWNPSFEDSSALQINVEIEALGRTPSLDSSISSWLSPTQQAFIDSNDGHTFYTPQASVGSVAWQSEGVASPDGVLIYPLSADTVTTDGQSGFYGGLDNMTASTPDTLASGYTDANGGMGTVSENSSPMSKSAVLVDMKLPGMLNSISYSSSFCGKVVLTRSLAATSNR
jgi:hypothetical protein